MKLAQKDKVKIFRYINFLQEQKGHLGEPYTRHIIDKIRELRIDFGKNRHRIFYFTFIDKRIILLHAFLKKTQKTPIKEKNKAKYNYQDFINNPIITFKKYD
ncbi:MAG: type II toxin-antitoxin system RelE/ParE family toxin [Candidatus Omnitrophica bacterium]|nr:type II toxin-antitoxin system RelE/ParE family toxin [Candidatus Omnitrophota bacterium]